VLLFAFLLGMAVLELTFYMLLPSHPITSFCFMWFFFGGAFFAGVQQWARWLAERRWRRGREAATSE
jgi:predicted MFS family arabinose efflux permease